MPKRGSVVLVVLIAGAWLLTPQSVSARRPRPKPPTYGFVFDGEATHTFHEHLVNESGCSGDITQKNTAEWHATWSNVELPPLGHKRTYRGTSRTFKGENEYKDEIHACGEASPANGYECNGTSASTGAPVRMTITANSRDPIDFTVAIRAVGGVKNEPSSCSSPPWASVLKKTISLTVPGLPGYHRSEDLSQSAPLNCLPGQPPEVKECTSGLDWHGTFEAGRSS